MSETETRLPPAPSLTQSSSAQTATADSDAGAQAGASSMLFGFWYPAIQGVELKAGRMKAVTLLETPLCVGRDAEGKAFALTDLCPHRAMPLSFGRVEGTAVECCYHGWKFDAHDGHCRAIPSLAPDSNVKVERIFAGCYPCEERDGTVWVFLPDPAVREGEGRSPATAAAGGCRTSATGTRASTMGWSSLPMSIRACWVCSTPRTGPTCTSRGIGARRTSKRIKQKTFEPIPEDGFTAWCRMRRQQIRRPTRSWASTASRC